MARKATAKVTAPRKKAPRAAKVATAAGPVAIALGADLRIAQAGEVFSRLLAAREAGEAVIDGGEVARIDAAGLQALAVALVTLDTAGVAWQWQTPSGTLSAAAALAGLEATLRLK